MNKPTVHSWFLRFVGITGILLQLYLFLYGCSTPSDMAAPVSSPDHSLYSAKCGSCHRLLPPQEYSAQTRRHYEDKYGKNLTAAQKQQMLNYLTLNAADASQTNTKPGDL